MSILKVMMLLAVMLLCVSGEPMPVVVLIEVSSNPEELNDEMTLRTLIGIVQDGLGMLGGGFCVQVCDRQLKNCLKCGQVLGSAEKAQYNIIYKGSTEGGFREAASTMRPRVEVLFGAEDVDEVGVYEATGPEPVYASITVSRTVQQLVPEIRTVEQKVNGALDRTDSSCIKICEVAANICRSCDEQVITFKMDLIVVVKGKADPDADMDRLSSKLEVEFVNVFPFGDLKSTSLSFTNPDLPVGGEGSDSDVDTLSPKGVPAIDTPVPSTTSPITVPTTGTQQELVIKLQITIELATLAENSEALAEKSTAALGGIGGYGCMRICEVQKGTNDEFTVTTTCYDCKGQALVRRGATLNAKRWEITMSGRAPVEMEEFSRALVGGVTGFVDSIGGTLNTVAVTSTGEVVTNPGGNDSDDELSGGVIAGIVIGCVVGIAVIIVVIYCLVCKKHVSALPEDFEVEGKQAPDSTV
eukprot:TRINITY_DN5164_c0_g1_i2.p1 TRINITY_DN5164_c0_g1~~TRINITY_DN5164_c0_g1_i2.p1  ORF type:complete len:487 (+),score=119.14 TRINITY_DN5164_c0_g1_i2:54-1463(+)